MMKMIKDYFYNKKKTGGENYDPDSEFDMFILAMKGFAVTRVYSDDIEEENNEKLLNRIIGLFK